MSHKNSITCGSFVVELGDFYFCSVHFCLLTLCFYVGYCNVINVVAWLKKLTAPLTIMHACKSLSPRHVFLRHGQLCYGVHWSLCCVFLNEQQPLDIIIMVWFL